MSPATLHLGLWRVLVLGIGGGAAAVMGACNRESDAVAAKPASCCVEAGQTPAQVAGMFDVPDFSLTERDGSTVTRQDLKGKVWIADFIYTTCGGPCPMMSTRMAGLAKELPGSDDLRFVSFSVDPDRDTPAVLQGYAKRYGADPKRWLFLTGPRESVYSLSTRGFRLALNTDSASAAEHAILHSTRFVLVDRDGKILGYYDGLEARELTRLKDDVRRLLERKPSDAPTTRPDPAT